ncbi:hypothetical protein ACTFIR_005133 [Dictyostelium discoideum]
MDENNKNNSSKDLNNIKKTHHRYSAKYKHSLVPSNSGNSGISGNGVSQKELMSTFKYKSTRTPRLKIEPTIDNLFPSQSTSKSKSNTSNSSPITIMKPKVSKSISNYSNNKYNNNNNNNNNNNVSTPTSTSTPIPTTATATPTATPTPNGNSNIDNSLFTSLNSIQTTINGKQSTMIPFSPYSLINCLNSMSNLDENEINNLPIFAPILPPINQQSVYNDISNNNNNKNDNNNIDNNNNNDNPTTKKKKVKSQYYMESLAERLSNSNDE